MPSEQSNVIQDFAKYLEYGMLGLSAILALLGFFIFYKCISETSPNTMRINAAKYFLVFSLCFLIVSGIMKAVDRYFIPVEAKIRVEIEPWFDESDEARESNQPFYVNTPNDGRKEYKGEGLVVTVKEDSKIECMVYPLHTRIKTLSSQLANLINTSQSNNPNSFGGLGDD